jgi:hypothetical protein
MSRHGDGPGKTNQERETEDDEETPHGGIDLKGE